MCFFLAQRSSQLCIRFGLSRLLAPLPPCSACLRLETWRSAHIIFAFLPLGQDEEALSMELMLRREDDSLVARKPAAQFFAQCLQLHNARYVELEQAAPFAEITIRKGASWEVAGGGATRTVSTA